MMRTGRFMFVLSAILSLAACSNSGGYGISSQSGSLEGWSSDPGLDTGNISNAANETATTVHFREVVGDRILFEVDQSALSAQGRVVLDGQARWLQANPDYVAIIEGHADERGTRQYNLALGARRADAARSYLFSKGIANTRLKVVSFGKERPIELCSNETCYAKNRRAVTVLVDEWAG